MALFPADEVTLRSQNLFVTPSDFPHFVFFSLVIPVMVSHISP